MAYAIMRCKKLSTFGSVASSLKHCYRDRETPNADQDRTQNNAHFAASTTDEAMGKLRNMLPEKRRKDAVLAVEYVMSVSPEWWTKASEKDKTGWTEKSIDWLKTKYGADRLITATMHLDEITPHLSAFVVPLTQDGRLSAKDFIGGRDKMSRDQTSYAKTLESLGISRGVEGSRAKHQAVKKYYTEVFEPAKGHYELKKEDMSHRVLKKGFFSDDFENLDQVVERLENDIHDFYEPSMQLAKKSADYKKKAEEYEKKYYTAQEKNKELKEENDKYRQLFSGMTRRQLEDLLSMANRFKAQNKREKIQAEIAKKEELQRKPAEGILRALDAIKPKTSANMQDNKENTRKQPESSPENMEKKDDSLDFGM